MPGADGAFDLGTPEAAKPVVLARGKGRMVLAYGRAAATQALEPDARLESAPTYAAYLEAFSVLALGAKREGDALRSRFVAGLK